MRYFQKRKQKEIISWLLLCCLGSTTFGVVLLYPKEAKGILIVEDIGTEIATAATAGFSKVDLVMQGLEWSLGVALNLMIHQVLAQLTNDVVNWIQNDEDPRFMTEGLGKYLGNAANNAMGAFVQEALGFDDFCEPFSDDIKSLLQIQNPLEITTFEENAKCTITDMVDNVQDFYNNFANGGWGAFIALTEPQNNFYETYLNVINEANKRKTEAEDTAEQDIESGEGFLSTKECVWYDENGKKVVKQKDVRGEPRYPSECEAVDGGCPTHKCTILTPATTIKAIANEAVTNVYEQYNTYLGAILKKTGPLETYLMAIANALVARVAKEGVGLLRVEPETKPSALGIGTNPGGTTNPIGCKELKTNPTVKPTDGTVVGEQEPPAGVRSCPTDGTNCVSAADCATGQTCTQCTWDDPTGNETYAIPNCRKCSGTASSCSTQSIQAACYIGQGTPCKSQAQCNPGVACTSCGINQFPTCYYCNDSTFPESCYIPSQEPATDVCISLPDVEDLIEEAKEDAEEEDEDDEDSDCPLGQTPEAMCASIPGQACDWCCEGDNCGCPAGDMCVTCDDPPGGDYTQRRKITACARCMHILGDGTWSNPACSHD